MAKNVFSIIIVISFAIFASLPLLHKGLPPTHDGEYHIVRFYEFNKALLEGNLYPRWSGDFNNGFGIPLFNFVYPLPNYIASLFYRFGISFIDIFKYEMFFALILSGIFFYLWSKEFWGRLGGIVSSIFYIFSPYHFVDIYVRGSVGEVWALAFFPAFLWSYTRFVRTRQKSFFVFSSLFIALVIFSHNILALMFFPLSLSYIALLIYQNLNRKYLIPNTCCIILLGLGLSAIFWFPALIETKYVTGLQIFDIFAHFPDLYEFLIPSWGSGFSGESIQNKLSFQIGIANLIAVFFSFLILFFRIKGDRKRVYIIFFIILFTLIFFLMLPISFPIWKIVPFMNYFQFPWRLLSLEILVASFLAGSVPFFIRSYRMRIVVAIIFIFLTFSLSIGYTKPAYYHYRNDNYYLTRSNFINGTNSPGNVFNTIYLGSIPKKEKEKAVFLKGQGKIILSKEKTNFYSFTVNAYKASEIRVNIAYYPGWEVYVNGKNEPVNFEDGRIAFFVPKGVHRVDLEFGEIFIRKFATFVSIMSFIIIIVLLIKIRFARI